jgi:hypothetical protein
MFPLNPDQHKYIRIHDEFVAYKKIGIPLIELAQIFIDPAARARLQ